jgi:hypothetical protein
LASIEHKEPSQFASISPEIIAGGAVGRVRFEKFAVLRDRAVAFQQNGAALRGRAVL